MAAAEPLSRQHHHPPEPPEASIGIPICGPPSSPSIGASALLVPPPRITAGTASSMPRIAAYANAIFSQMRRASWCGSLASVQCVSIIIVARVSAL